MRKRNFKGRCTKRSIPKCNEVCRTYDAVQTAYADVLDMDEDVREFKCNVYLSPNSRRHPTIWTLYK